MLSLFALKVAALIVPVAVIVLMLAKFVIVFCVPGVNVPLN
mgnify:CR=1 FL=1